MTGRPAPWYSVGQTVTVCPDFRRDGDHVRHLPDRKPQPATVERIGNVMTTVVLDATTPAGEPIRLHLYEFDIYTVEEATG